MVKRVRGRKGLDYLEKLKKGRLNKFMILQDLEDSKNKEVDEKLILAAKNNKGRIITCDYNLEKKAAIGGVLAINVNTLANHLKITAVPGEALHIGILHKGKEMTQGVGYLDDGTMLVVENASEDLGKTVDVVVSRVIQTTAGRILFAKRYKDFLRRTLLGFASRIGRSRNPCPRLLLHPIIETMSIKSLLNKSIQININDQFQPHLFFLTININFDINLS